MARALVTRIGGRKQEEGRQWRKNIQGYPLQSVLYPPGTQLSIKRPYDVYSYNTTRRRHAEFEQYPPKLRSTQNLRI